MFRRLAKVPVRVRVLSPVMAAVAVAALVVVSGNGSTQAAPVAVSDTQRLATAEPATAGSSAGPTSSAVPSTSAGLATKVSETTSSTPRPAAVVAPAAAPAPAAAAQPVEGPWFMGRVGRTSRVISVAGTGGSNATLSAWERSETGWTRAIGPVAAKVGPIGISRTYGESSSATPAGAFAITSAFGRQPDPGSGLPYLQVDNSDWWVSDVNSPDYNTHQRCARGTCPFNESKSENLWDQGPVYDYALVMGVNSERVPGGGSAFFVHVTNGAATAGCVAIPASTLVSLMRWVRPGTVIALSPS
ncbi:L,D-transpeptidase [Lentzea sp. NPDC051213]|uniref:L,D-transpeptidase n=1 Tax=Lentzea sp. NPDC051213 TaxID=3364126 RepID=UPI0037A82B41